MGAPPPSPPSPPSLPSPSWSTSPGPSVLRLPAPSALPVGGRTVRVADGAGAREVPGRRPRESDPRDEPERDFELLHPGDRYVAMHAAMHAYIAEYTELKLHRNHKVFFSQKLYFVYFLTNPNVDTLLVVRRWWSWILYAACSRVRRSESTLLVYSGPLEQRGRGRGRARGGALGADVAHVLTSVPTSLAGPEHSS